MQYFIISKLGGMNKNRNMSFKKTVSKLTNTQTHKYIFLLCLHVPSDFQFRIGLVLINSGDIGKKKQRFASRCVFK